MTENAPGRWDRGAFFDVDGTLVATNVVDAYAYYVFHRGTIFGTAQRLLRGLAMAPIYALSDRMNRKVFNELFYRSYRGLSEDRLVELSQDLCDKVLKPAVYPAGNVPRRNGNRAKQDHCRSIPAGRPDSNR